MPIHYTETPGTNIAEIRVSGFIDRAAYDDAVEKLTAFIEDKGEIRLIEIVDSLGGFDPSVLWPGIRFDLKYIPRITHCAVVTDIGWMGPLSKAAGSVISTRLRTFDIAHLEDARRWIAEA